MGHRTVKLIERARRRGPDHHDRLAAGGGAALGGQDLAAQPQAGGAGGGSRRHRPQPQLPAPPLRRLLPDRHRGHQPRVAVVRPAASTWNPCLQCNLCVASCPTDAIQPDGNVRLLRLLQPHLSRLDPRLSRPGAATSPRLSRRSSASAGPTTRSRRSGRRWRSASSIAASTASPPAPPRSSTRSTTIATSGAAISTRR